MTATLFRNIGEDMESSAALQADFLHRLTAENSRVGQSESETNLVPLVAENLSHLPSDYNDWLCAFGLETAPQDTALNGMAFDELLPTSSEIDIGGSSVLLPNLMPRTDLTDLNNVGWDHVRIFFRCSSTRSSSTAVLLSMATTFSLYLIAYDQAHKDGVYQI